MGELCEPAVGANFRSPKEHYENVDSIRSSRINDVYKKIMGHEKPDRIILLGDLLYHGPRNGIPEEYDTKEAFDLLNSKAEMITCVRGNCDSEVDEVVLDFLIEARHMILSDSGLNIFITHGHFYNTGHLPPMVNIDVLMHGHTHVPACEEIGEGKYYMNPGSVSIPKGGSDHSYIMYENRKFEWKILDDGKVYMEKQL